MADAAGRRGAVSAYLAEAREAGATCALISSEELDYVLQVPQKAQAIEAEAREAGVTDIRWVAALRRPSEAFRSNISELTKHGIHVDPLQGYMEVMRTGGLHFTGRLNGGVEFWNWFFTFDYGRYFDRLARRCPGASSPMTITRRPFAGRADPARVLRGGEALMDGIDPPGQVNVRLAEDATAEPRLHPARPRP
jgi:hypothetical protein